MDTYMGRKFARLEGILCLTSQGRVIKHCIGELSNVIQECRIEESERIRHRLCRLCANTEMDLPKVASHCVSVVKALCRQSCSFINAVLISSLASREWSDNEAK